MQPIHAILASMGGLSKHVAQVLATALLLVHNHQKLSRKQKGRIILLSLDLPSKLLGQLQAAYQHHHKCHDNLQDHLL